MLLGRRHVVGIPGAAKMSLDVADVAASQQLEVSVRSRTYTLAHASRSPHGVRPVQHDASPLGPSPHHEQIWSRDDRKCVSVSHVSPGTRQHQVSLPRTRWWWWWRRNRQPAVSSLVQEPTELRPPHHMQGSELHELFQILPHELSELSAPGSDSSVHAQHGHGAAV